jgi:hypothetical protein
MGPFRPASMPGGAVAASTVPLGIRAGRRRRADERLGVRDSG